jgi:hypothetical protein
MATLTDGAKRFIVQALACYDTPQQVADAVKEELGVDVHRAQVAQYDPTKQSGSKLAKKWRVMFDDTRKRFREETAEIPIAQRAFRLRAMNRMLERAERSKNIPLAAQLLEQAAKEMGDTFVNRQRSDSKEGGEQPQPTQVVMTVVDARKHDDS